MSQFLVELAERGKSPENLIINGAFDYWQRGTSFPAIADGTYISDRWQYTKNGSMVHTVSQDTDVPTVAQAGEHLPFSLRLQLTTPSADSSSDLVRIQHKIEGQMLALLRNETAYMSFWVKADTVGTYFVNFRNGGNGAYFNAPYTISQANTWEKKVIEIRLSDAIGTWDWTINSGMQINWIITAGSSFQSSTINQWAVGSSLFANSTQVNGVASGSTNFRLAGVMFSKHKNASFVRAGFNPVGELALCHRYYERIPWEMPFNAYGAAGAQTIISSLYFSRKRSQPAGSVAGTVAYFNSSALTLSVMGFNSLMIGATCTALGNFRITSQHTLVLDAEL